LTKTIFFFVTNRKEKLVLERILKENLGFLFAAIVWDLVYFYGLIDHRQKMNIRLIFLSFFFSLNRSFYRMLNAVDAASVVVRDCAAQTDETIADNPVVVVDWNIVGFLVLV